MHSLIKDGINLPSFAMLTKIEDREVLPNQKINKVSLYKNKTRKIKNKLLEDKTLKLTIALKYENMEDLRTKVRELSSYFSSENSVPYIFSDEPLIAWNGIADTSSMGLKKASSGDLTITIDCEPLSVDTINQVSDLNTEFINNGTEDISEWQIEATLTSDCLTGLKLSLLTDRYMFINTPLLIGDIVTLTSEDRRLYINDIDVTENIQQTTVDWFEIPTGAQTITTDPATLTGTITYKRRYL